MFGKLMSSLGMQGISLDTHVNCKSVQAGGIITGEIRFKGGASDKEINGLVLQLMTIAEVESGDHGFNQPVMLQHWPVAEKFVLAAHQQQLIPFHLQIPFETPVTEVACRRNATRVWLHTHLDVDWGADAKDRDYLNVLPTPAMQAFLQAMQHCGFALATVDVEKGQVRGHNFQSSVGCYQELEFVPTQMFSGLNEVEVTFVAEPYQTHVMLEIDRKFRSDQLLSLTLPHQHLDVQQIAQHIRQLLNLHS